MNSRKKQMKLQEKQNAKHENRPNWRIYTSKQCRETDGNCCKGYEFLSSAEMKESLVSRWVVEKGLGNVKFGFSNYIANGITVGESLCLTFWDSFVLTGIAKKMLLVNWGMCRLRGYLWNDNFKENDINILFYIPLLITGFETNNYYVFKNLITRMH